MQQLISSGLETASFLASSGLLSRSWNIIAELNHETHPNEDLFWKELNNGSYSTTIAFGTMLKHVQPDLLPSTEMIDNPFEFLCSRRNPQHFSVNHSAMSLFNDHGQKLGQLRSEIDLKKPVIVTGHGVGGSIASLFTLWLIEKMDTRWDKRPLCITFGSPLMGDKCLQEAISRSSNWNSCFLHVVSHCDALVSSFISNDSYRPFGTFLLCSHSGSTCSDNPDSILRLLKEMGSTPDNQGYGNIVDKLTGQSICKDPGDVPNISQNLLQASFALQLQMLGCSNPQWSQSNLVKGLEKQEVLLTLNKRKRFIPHKKLVDMKSYMAQLEWFKKTGKRIGCGYYDSYKSNKSATDLDVSTFVKILNSYWKDMVEEVDKQPQKEGAAFRTRWLYAGTNYRRMVEPLDIAQYYRTGGKDYINNGRSRHYELLQKWQEEDQKGRQLEEDKKTEALNRKINVQAILTWDSCFWAHVEEAMMSLQKCKVATCSEVEKQEIMERLKEFEEYVYGLLKNYRVSPDIFLEQSTYMRWWNDYITFKGSSHHSSLANFMKNYVMYENGEYDFPADV